MDSMYRMTDSWLVGNVCRAFIEVWVWSDRYLWQSKGLFVGVWLRYIPPAGHQKGGGSKQPRRVGGDGKNLQQHLQLSVLPDQVHTAAGHISCCVALMPCGPLESSVATKTDHLFMLLGPLKGLECAWVRRGGEITCSWARWAP